jgi:hypothetical protein
VSYMPPWAPRLFFILVQKPRHFVPGYRMRHLQCRQSAHHQPTEIPSCIAQKKRARCANATGPVGLMLVAPLTAG